jgi:hypothetical protein
MVVGWRHGAPREVFVFKLTRLVLIVGLAASGSAGAVRALRAAPAEGAGAAPSAAVPDTPAGGIFKAWLAAFNAADRAGLEAVFKQFREPRPVEGALDFRRRTGGFDLRKVLESTPTRLRVWLQEHGRDQIAEALMDVEAQPPHLVVGWGVRAIPTPDELLTGEQRLRSTIDAGKQRRLVERIAEKIEAHYVLPEVGQKMNAALREHAARGDYDKITLGGPLGAAFTKDLRDVSHDLHVRVDFSLVPPPPPPEARPPAARLAELRARNFGFGPIARLPGNIAHLVIDAFVPADDEEVRRGIGALMTQVADADALLVDLRENHGGAPPTVALVASYLFEAKPVHLNDMYKREDRSTRAFWTLREVSGKRFGRKKPIYVLTSKQTFSGGEELAYDLQSLKRAQLVGEATGGGAHPIAPHDLGDGFTIQVPWGQPINPVTKTNWEGTGVVPDIKVPAAAALEEARRRALQDIERGRSGARRPRKAGPGG